MANQNYSEFPERRAASGGSAPDPIPRKAGAVGAGRQGTYTHPKSGKPRKIVKPIGRRVKTSMVENF